MIPLTIRRPFYAFASQAQKPIATNRFDYYASLRIHKNKSLFALINNIFVNQCMKVNFLVDNGPQLIAGMYKILPHPLANFLINRTIGKVFTAGEDLASVERNLQSMKEFPFIFNYCSEAVDGQANQDSFFDENSEVFQKTVEVTTKFPKERHMVSYKISSLIEMELLKKINVGKLRITKMFDQLSQGTNSVTLNQIVQAVGVELTADEAKQLAEEIFKVGSLDAPIDRTTYQFRFQPVFMFHPEFNKNPLIEAIHKLTETEMEQFRKYVERTRYFMDPAAKHGVRVMVDSEQSYLQQTIDSFTEQMQEHYNQNQVVVMNTIQNYLKSSGPRIDYELERAERFGMAISLKMVRGAYMLEENRIAKQQGVESPINDGFEATTKMFERNMNLVLSRSKMHHTEVIVASHNEKTAESAKELMTQYGIPKDGDVMFGQLYGLSDHMSYSLLAEGYRIYKYIPFGKTEIMIPYLMRRAQETRMVLQQSSLQTKLMVDELKHRFWLK